MTLYRPISDLHTEFWPENPKDAVRMIDQLIPTLPDDAETTLLLAGDTGSHRRRNIYTAIVDHFCGRFRRVLDIPGNHLWNVGSDWAEAAPPFERQTTFWDKPSPTAMWSRRRSGPISSAAIRSSNLRASRV